MTLDDIVDDYQVVRTPDILILETQVKKMLEKGWQPFGSMVVYKESILWFSQPMVKYVPRFRADTEV